jgi:hypothetical protein
VRGWTVYRLIEQWRYRVVRVMTRAIGAASLITFLSSVVFSQPSVPQQKATARGLRPEVVELAPEAARWDKVVAGVLPAFDRVDVVALAATRGRQGSDLRLRLIGHPDFPNKVRFIVVERGNSLWSGVTRFTNRSLIATSRERIFPLPDLRNLGKIKRKLPHGTRRFMRSPLLRFGRSTGKHSWEHHYPRFGWLPSRAGLVASVQCRVLLWRHTVSCAFALPRAGRRRCLFRSSGTF